MAVKETLRRREYQRQRHIENREELNERSSRWYYANREKVLARHKERMATDPDYAEKIRRKDRRNYRLRKGAAKRAQNSKERNHNNV